MSVITLDNIKNEKHRRVLKYISDIFDENRGRITDNVAFTSFKDSNHTILFNTLSPELNGKSLIQFDNDKLLFAPVDINSIICNEPANNPSINILIISKNKNTWIGRSNDKILKFLITFDKKPSSISGFSIMFADAVRTKYKISLTLSNDDNEILSQVPSNMESSWETNNHQFFQLSNNVEGVTKAVMDIELVGVNKDFEWKINNISFYSNMNRESLKSLAELGMITWTPVNNAVLVKDLDQQQDGGKTAELLKLGQSQEDIVPSAPSIINTYTDHYGSPIPYKPIKDRQYFDNLTADQLIKMSNMTRLYTTTDLPTGDKIYTFEKNPSDELTIKLSPLEEMNKYPDEPVIELSKLTKPPGMIKKGGFKNYVLTFYIRLDELTMSDQELIWKYGGYYFNKARPELSKAVNVSIPINNKLGDKPHVSTEYTFGIKRFMDHSVNINTEESPFKGLEEGKWVGLQFIRQVDTENKHATQLVRINRDPFNSNNNTINTGNFEDYLLFYDIEMNDHIPHIWGGTQELISVKGSKYVSIYGLSLYEVELVKEKEES